VQARPGRHQPAAPLPRSCGCRNHCMGNACTDCHGCVRACACGWPVSRFTHARVCRCAELCRLTQTVDAGSSAPPPQSVVVCGVTPDGRRYTVRCCCVRRCVCRVRVLTAARWCCPTVPPARSACFSPLMWWLQRSTLCGAAILDPVSRGSGVHPVHPPVARSRPHLSPRCRVVCKVQERSVAVVPDADYKPAC